ncbi:hypothetical protein NITUZ_60001 [Candidatus Nitrosotenuis uzonensis]|uniref:Transposase IS4-like domain-containing protein n=1 Tax=Candidatus Nitrosotenuis uzonensis TaxID=1407055 RepID=V6AV97_9ARCH|nr:hypothetical protein NITUZ_60001 [Candidatus Nitrosotenuis uzonensis]
MHLIQKRYSRILMRKISRLRFGSKNAIPNVKGCYAPKIAVLAKSDYSKWASSVSYGSRWIVELLFSSIKRMFGEEV